jgi:acetoin utilization protein AcuC
VEAAFAGDPRVLMLSVHEEARWPFSGGICDSAGGRAFNLPVPRGFNDSEMAAVLDGLILPRLAAFRPQAVVLQCGADALEEDPLSRLSLSSRAHLGVVAALRPLAPRFLVLGGGGYNPWSVGRLWTAVWGLLSGQPFPDRLPPQAAEVLARLSWGGGGRPAPAPHLLTTLIDAPREGPVRQPVRDGLAMLAAR